MRIAAAIVVLGLAGLALAPDAPGAPVNVSQVFVTLDASRSAGDLLSVASKGCIEFGPFEWDEKKSAHTIEWSGSSIGVTGKIDFTARSGTAEAHGTGALVVQATTSRPITVGQIGIELSGSSAYVVGSLGTGQAKGPHVKLLRIAPVAFKEGPLTDRKHHQPIANSVYAQISGRVTIAAPFAAELNHIRCKRPGSRAIRPGLPVGTVTAQLFPDGATTTQATLQLVGVGGVTEDNGQPFVFGAVAPATIAASTQTLSFPSIAGTTLALSCDAGVDCILQNGHANLGGGFTMASHGVTETFTALALDYGPPIAEPTVNLTATLNGAPVTLSNTSDLTLAGDIATNLTTAFGAQVDVTLGRLALQSTALRTP
jgi:hypothetical protein